MYSTKGQIHRNDKGSAQPRTPGHAVRSLDGVAGPQIHPATILQRAQLDPGSLTAGDGLRLQRMIGNRAVCQLMESMNPIQAQLEKEEDEEPVELMKAPVQMKPNNTGMPDNLKAGVESLSGNLMDDVRVHYNSDKPTGLGALAYTQGTDIHVAPGQERHLAHEAWHAVQQKEGRVKPTGDIGGIPLNDSRLLETEADAMGAKALQLKIEKTRVENMYAQVEKPKENKSRAIANSVAQKKGNVKQGFGFMDNRAEAKQTAQLQSIVKDQSVQQFQTIPQKTTNKNSKTDIKVHSDNSFEFSVQSPVLSPNKHQRLNFGSIEQPGSTVLQRTPMRVISTGITHLVHENANSIFEGFEVGRFGELEPGDKLVIEDGDIIVSRRGPHTVDDPMKREQYRTGEQIYDWYRVIVVKNQDVREQHLYVRDQTFIRNTAPYVPELLGREKQKKTLESFKTGCKLFQANQEMSFQDFKGLLLKAGFEGSIHEEDSENKPLIDNSQPRKNFIDALRYSYELATRELYGDEAAVRDELLDSALTGSGCIAAQTRMLEDRRALVDNLLDGHAKVLDIFDISSLLHKTEEVRQFVRKELGKLIESDQKVIMDSKDFEQQVRVGLEACNTFEIMLKRNNTQIILRTLAGMDGFLQQFLYEEDGKKRVKILGDMGREYTTMIPVWGRICPQLPELVTNLSQTELEMLQKLDSVREKVRLSQAKFPEKVLNKLWENPTSYLEEQKQIIGRNMELKIQYIPLQSQKNAGKYKFVVKGKEVIVLRMSFTGREMFDNQVSKQVLPLFNE
jgi:hypothetical protein